MAGWCRLLVHGIRLDLQRSPMVMIFVMPMSRMALLSQIFWRSVTPPGRAINGLSDFSRASSQAPPFARCAEDPGLL